jgi:hypothetical protein
MYRKFYIYVFVLILPFFAACSGNGKIIEAYNSGNFDTVRKLCGPRAEKDDSSCLYLLGRMAYEGSGEVSNKEEAFKLLEKASSFNHRHAQLLLGLAILQDRGEIIPEDEGIGYIQSAARGGLYEAAVVYNRLASIINLTDEEKKEKEELVKAAAEGGNSSAQLVVGGMYCVPVATTTECAEKGIPMFEKAAESNNITALRSLGVVYYSRNEFEKSVEPLRKAAIHGDGEAAFFIGRIYMAGGGYVDAYEWFRASLAAGFEGVKSQLAVYDQPENEGIKDEGIKRYATLEKIIERNILVLKKKETTSDVRAAFLDRNM